MSKAYRILSTVSILMILVFPSGFDMLQRPEQVLLQENLYLPLVMRSAVNQGSPTNTPSPTATRTPTSTRGSFSSSTSVPTATQTPTVTITPTVTLTPTYTATTTLIPLPSITIQYPTLTPSPTPSPTATQTPTPSPGYPIGFFSGLTPTGWLMITLLGLLWAILAVWLYVFLRQRG